MTQNVSLPLKPIPMKDRVSMIFVYYGRIDVKDGAFVVIDEVERRTQTYSGGFGGLHHAGAGNTHQPCGGQTCGAMGTLLIWVGEAGVRLYSSGQPGGARSDKLLYQAKLALDENLRLKVVRKMFEMRFGEKPPERRSVDQLRGIEGIRVKKLYELMAQQYQVNWKGQTV